MYDYVIYDCLFLDLFHSKIVHSLSFLFSFFTIGIGGGMQQCQCCHFFGKLFCKCQCDIASHAMPHHFAFYKSFFFQNCIQCQRKIIQTGFGSRPSFGFTRTRQVRNQQRTLFWQMLYSLIENIAIFVKDDEEESEKEEEEGSSKKAKVL